MAWPFLTSLLKVIPWKKAAIAAAPTVMDLTKKALKRVAKTNSAAKPNDGDAAMKFENQAARLAAIEDRVKEVEDSATEVENEVAGLGLKLKLHEERILELTAQVQILGFRLRALSLVAAVACIGAVGVITWIILRK